MLQRPSVGQASVMQQFQLDAERSPATRQMLQGAGQAPAAGQLGQATTVLVQTGTARSQAVVMGGSGFSAPDSPSPTYEPVLPAGYVTPGVYPGEGQGGHGRSQEVPQEQAVGSGSKVDLSCQYVDAFVRVCGCVSVCVHMCHICCRNL